MHRSILLPTGSGQCHVVQDKSIAECQFSVFVSICLTRIIDKLLLHFFAALSLQFCLPIYSEAQISKLSSNYGPGNHRYFGGQLLLGVAEISTVLRGFLYFSELRLL